MISTIFELVGTLLMLIIITGLVASYIKYKKNKKQQTHTQQQIAEIISDLEHFKSEMINKIDEKIKMVSNK